MTKLSILFPILLLTATYVKSDYSIIEGTNTMKAFFPLLFEKAINHLMRYSSFPDINDNDKKFEYIGLASNKWVKLTSKVDHDSISKYIINDKDNTIRVNLTHPLTYEIKGEFYYNFLIFFFWGNFVVKGGFSDIELILRLMNLPGTHKFNIQATKVEPIITIDSITVDSIDFLKNYFEIEKKIKNLILKNSKPIINSFAHALNESSANFFTNRYPEVITWNVSTLKNTSQWIFNNNFIWVTLNSVGNLVIAYDTTAPFNKIYDNQEVKVYQFSLGIEPIKRMIQSAHKSYNPTILDANLSKEIQDRLDVITLEKLIPAAALKSIKKYGLEDNYMEIMIQPKGELVYKLGDSRNQSILASYSYSFTNKKEFLANGTIEVLFKIIATWKKEGPLGYLNIQLKHGEVVNSTVSIVKYPVIVDRFKKFLRDVGAAYITKFIDGELIDKGIPFSDITASYDKTDIYWEESSSQITIEHH